MTTIDISLSSSTLPIPQQEQPIYKNIMSRLPLAHADFSDRSSEQDGSEEGLLLRTRRQKSGRWPLPGIYILAGAQTVIICFLLLAIFMLRRNNQCQSYFPTDLSMCTSGIERPKRTLMCGSTLRKHCGIQRNVLYQSSPAKEGPFDVGGLAG